MQFKEPDDDYFIGRLDTLIQQVKTQFVETIPYKHQNEQLSPSKDGQVTLFDQQSQQYKRYRITKVKEKYKIQGDMNLLPTFSSIQEQYSYNEVKNHVIYQQPTINKIQQSPSRNNGNIENETITPYKVIINFQEPSSVMQILQKETKLVNKTIQTDDLQIILNRRDAYPLSDQKQQLNDKNDLQHTRNLTFQHLGGLNYSPEHYKKQQNILVAQWSDHQSNNKQQNKPPLKFSPQSDTRQQNMAFNIAENHNQQQNILEAQRTYQQSKTRQNNKPLVTLSPQEDINQKNEVNNADHYQKQQYIQPVIPVKHQYANIRHAIVDPVENESNDVKHQHTNIRHATADPVENGSNDLLQKYREQTQKPQIVEPVQTLTPRAKIQPLQPITIVITKDPNVQPSLSAFTTPNIKDMSLIEDRQITSQITPLMPNFNLDQSRQSMESISSYQTQGRKIQIPISFPQSQLFQSADVIQPTKVPVLVSEIKQPLKLSQTTQAIQQPEDQEALKFTFHPKKGEHRGSFMPQAPERKKKLIFS